MKACPPPTGSLLPAQHRPFLANLFRTLVEHEFRQGRLRPLLPAVVRDLGALCKTDDDLRAWCDELSLWVRWYRVPALWLTFILQLLTKERASSFHFLACALYSDAQTLFADDLSLSSLETAYVSLLRSQAAWSEPAEVVARQLRAKLRIQFNYYRHWSRSFSYKECNPCADHLYTSLSGTWLKEDVRDQAGQIDLDDAESLSNLIARSTSDDVAFHRIVARRFLGLVYARQGKCELSVPEYELALHEARQRKLDTEIGHLRRLLGCALRATGRAKEARHHFEQALAYERLEPFFSYAGYWQALSARELGDTAYRLAVGPTWSAGDGSERVVHDIHDREYLRLALQAYHLGRLHLGTHLCMQSPFPIARAAKQQLFRSFSTNAIQVAAFLGEPQDVLAEVEWSGPRQATEIVTELAAAQTLETPLAEFRRTRAAYYDTLTTAPTEFDEYLAKLTPANADRRSYLQQSLALGQALQVDQWCDKLVERAAELRLANTLFLLFHVGTDTSVMVLMDVGSGQATPFPAKFGERHLQKLHEDYQRKALVSTRELALGELLSAYADLLAPLLEPVLPFLPGKHLKIFPRLHMNAVPLHAVVLQGKCLLDHCETMSYGQTLGLFLANHQSKMRQHDLSLRTVMGEDVPLYELLLPKVREAYGSGFREERHTSWPPLLASISSAPASDTLFACHGTYDPDNLDGSHLEIGSAAAGGHINFHRMFAELDLRGCRSVIMGACESGLARVGVAAEYIGLPSAMLASGVRYVVGALWKIPQLATAVLMDRYLEMTRDPSIPVCAALSRAQREVKAMTREQVSDWFRTLMPAHPDLDEVLREVSTMAEFPFAHPHQWAGLQVVGDI